MPFHDITLLVIGAIAGALIGGPLCVILYAACAMNSFKDRQKKET